MDTAIVNKYAVTLKRVESVHVASIRGVTPSIDDLPETFDELYATLDNYIERKGHKVGQPVAIYLDMGQGPRMLAMHIELAIPFVGPDEVEGKVRVYDLPAIENAGCTIHKGPYEEMSAAYDAILAWARENGYHPSGASREVYLTFSEGDPANNITEVQMPVAK